MSDFTKEYVGDEKKLRVKDAFKKDAGRGIVRIDPEIQEEYNLKTGDVIEIIYTATNKKTVAILYSGRKKDKNSGFIRLDSSLRRNIGAALDDLVEIRKIEAVFAEKVSFAGLKEADILKFSQQLVRKLENRVITKDDILSFYAYGKRVDLVVIDYNPKSDAVRIHLGTKII